MDNGIGKKIKFFHSSDWHLGTIGHSIRSSYGLPVTVLWVISAVDEMFEFAKKFHPGIIFLCGDILHRPSPSPITENALASCVRKFLGLGAKVFFLLGNHEHSAIGENPLEIYRTLDIPGVIVADRADVYELEIEGNELQVAAMPFNAIRDKNPVSVLENLADRIDHRKPSVLAAHIYLEGAYLSGTDRVPITGEPKLMPETLKGLPFQYVALGHVHRYQRVLNLPAVYSGSIQRINFAEEGQQKGFVYGSIEHKDFWRAEWDFMPVNAINFKTFKFDLRGASDPTEKILSLLGDEITDAIVRILYKQYVREPLPSSRRIRNAVLDKGALSCEIHRVTEKSAQENVSFQSPSGNIISDIERYIRTNRPELISQLSSILQMIQKLLD